MILRIFLGLVSLVLIAMPVQAQNADLGDPNTWVGHQTFSGGVTLGGGSAGIPHGLRDYACVFFNGIDAAIHDQVQLLIAPYNIELSHIACACMGSGCTTNPSFSLQRVGGGALAYNSLTCGGTLATSWVPVDTGDLDHILAEGEGIRLDTNSATMGDKVIVCVRYTVQ